MANFAGYIQSFGPVNLYSDDRDIGTAPASSLPAAEVNAPSALDPGATLAGPYTFVDAKPDKVTETDYIGHFGSDLVGTFDWYETFHVIPRRFDFGNLLTAQQEPIEVYSAFRDDDHVWSAFVNNAGDGISLLGQPSLPVVVPPQTGIVMTLQVDTAGEPNVDSTLDFVFDTGTTPVPITLQRVVLFPLAPESGYLEMLEFSTEIIEHDDGSEQRISWRKNPRQMFDWKVVVEDGASRSRLENILYEWQRRIFGIPVWHEQTRLTASVSIGTTVLPVAETDFRDLREGGLVLIYQDDYINDVGTIAVGGIGANTITLESGILSAYPSGTQVIPLRTGAVRGVVNGRRYPSGAQELTIKFRVDENDANLADTSAWTMLNSKVLLDDCNAIQGTLTETFDQQVTIIDNSSGKVYQSSGWQYHKRGSGKTFWTNSLEGLWTIRQLLHALRGRQISFYLPTFVSDLQPTEDLVSGAQTMTIQNVGYNQFVKGRQNKNIIRITFKDGSTPLIRTITDYDPIDALTESITVNTVWPSTITPDQIDKVMFVEEVRFNSDTIRIQHTPGQRTVRVSAPVITVFE